MARPPMRMGNHTLAHPATTSSNTTSQRSAQAGGARSAPGQSQAAGVDQHPPLDCSTIYELFVTSVTAMISYHLVKSSGVVALGFRTFVTKPILQAEHSHPNDTLTLHWLTSINVHWVSIGTLLVSTSTGRHQHLKCLDVILPEDERQVVGKCIRVAPNGMLARISSFEDPLEVPVDDTIRKAPKKKAKTASLEQSVQNWKATVERWLGWKGYVISNLNDNSSWVRIRVAHAIKSLVVSPISASSDRDMLWPRALCFIQETELLDSIGLDETRGQPSPSNLRWFETSISKGFQDPLDVAQDWFLGKVDRDRILDARRKAKKTEEDAVRRKDEPSGLFPSSPFNARGGVYGDLQAVSGVYPTPPDGVAPGPGLSSVDTPSVSGGNVVLVPGGTNPAINLSAPQDQPPTDEQQEPATSPAFPATSEPFQTSGDNDDLFEDTDGETYGANGVNDADFDFFDGPDEDDVDMSDAPELPRAAADSHVKPLPVAEAKSLPKSATEDETSDPLAALENALATPALPTDEDMQDVESESPQKTKAPLTQGVKKVVTVQLASPPSQDHARATPPTPPLSSGTIAISLRPSPPNKASSRKGHPADSHALPESSFHSLDFSRRLSLVDAKYQEGRYAAPVEDDADDKTTQISAGAPQARSLRDMPLLSKLRYALGAASATTLPEVMSSGRADSDESDSGEESETSEASEAEIEDVRENKPPPYLGRLIIPAKRKVPTEGHGTPMSVTSFADSFGGDWENFGALQLDESILNSFEPNTWDWRMSCIPAPVERPLAGARYAVPSLPPSTMKLPDTPTSQPDLSPGMPDEKPINVNGKDSIAVTQIVTDQIISATLDLLGEDQSLTSSSTPSVTEAHWQTALKRVFPKAADCSVTSLIAIHDVFPDLSAQGKGQQRPLPRKPNDSNAMPGNHIYLINPPFIRVRRADTHWDLLPPSIAFWEPLGLAPVSPAKNVVAFCIYPQSEALRPILQRFMLNLQLAYDTCKLGTHARVDTIAGYEGGLVPCRVESPNSLQDALKALKETCIQFGKLLATHHGQIREQQDAKIDAFVVYMVDPFGIPAALWELCSAFWSLFQAYGQGPSGRPDTPKPDLVLQVIPIKYLASFDVPVILDPSTYVNLAREVYDRCPPSTSSADKTPLSIYKAPAFQLEEGLPRNIQFKLISEPPQDLLRENSYMHLAYAVSLDGTWVTAAWTDNCGKSQAVVSYHLGTRPFGEIAKEIWQTTLEILSSRHVQWRVCIAKYGAMEREELETWVFLITCPSQVNLFLTLLTVIEDAPYRFTPPAPTAGNVATPASTPVSPDAAATPGPDAAPDPTVDPEARLVDVSDETCGVVLAHRLHNSNSTNQFFPALISGLIIKRGPTHSNPHSSPNPPSSPITTAINILWIGAVGSTRAATSPFPPATPTPGTPTHENSSPSSSSLMWTPTVQTRATAENLLKEVMGQFRGLGLLARLRGVRGSGWGSLPWHVVVVKRGVEGLGLVTGGRGV